MRPHRISGVAKMLVLTAVLLTPVVACGSSDPAGGDAGGSDPTGANVPASWADTLATAKKEGQVTIYSSQSQPDLDRMARICQEQYPDIKVNVVRGATDTLLGRIQQEQKTGVAGGDIWVATEIGLMRDWDKNGQLLAVEGPAATEFPDEYLRSDSGSIFTVEMAPIMMAYNKDTVSDPPKDYVDLLDSQFKDQIGTIDVISTLVTGWYDWLHNTYGDEFWKDLSGQNLIVHAGTADSAENLIGGGEKISLYQVPSVIKPLMDQGAPIDMIIPAKALAFEYFAVGFGWSQHPAATQVLLDCLQSRKTQEEWQSWGLSASPYPDIEGAMDASTWELYDSTQYVNDQKLVDQVRADVDELYGR